MRGVQDGCPLAQVTLWMMCMECCLVQLSTLHSKSPFFNPRESHPLARTPLPSKKTPSPPTPPPPPSLPRTPSSFLPASPGWTPSASCGSTGAGWRWAPTPVLRRHLFCSGTRVCWCWQGGAEGWRGSADGGRWNCPLGEEEIKERVHFHTPFFFFFLGNACMHL